MKKLDLRPGDTIRTVRNGRVLTGTVLDAEVPKYRDEDPSWARVRNHEADSKLPIFCVPHREIRTVNGKKPKGMRLLEWLIR